MTRDSSVPSGSRPQAGPAPGDAGRLVRPRGTGGDAGRSRSAGVFERTPKGGAAEGWGGAGPGLASGSMAGAGREGW